MSTSIPEAMPPEWIIRYSGPSASEATEVAQRLRSAGIPVGLPEQLPSSGAELGAEEIVLTIVVSAAVKALLEVSMSRLGSYVADLIKAPSGQHQDKKPNLQVIVQGQKGNKKHREVLNVRNATAETAHKFIDNIKGAVLKLLDTEFPG